MRLWLERFIIPICAAIVISLSILNPLKMDWRQRVSLGLAVTFFACFVGHALLRTDAAADPNQELKATLQGQQHEIDSLKQQLIADRAEEEEKRKRRLLLGISLACSWMRAVAFCMILSTATMQPFKGIG
jgi:hypothetical protein